MRLVWNYDPVTHRGKVELLPLLVALLYLCTSLDRNFKQTATYKPNTNAMGRLEVGWIRSDKKERMKRGNDFDRLKWTQIHAQAQWWIMNIWQHCLLLTKCCISCRAMATTTALLPFRLETWPVGRKEWIHWTSHNFEVDTWNEYTLFHIHME